MMTQTMYEEGLAYAESNFLDENAAHLHVDKRLIREKFNMDGKRVLDFGCGMGGMSLWYATNFKCEVHGIDIDRHHVKIANDLKAKHLAKNVNFEVRNVLDQPLEGKYDFIILSEVIEHLRDPREIMLGLKNMLKPQGKFFIKTKLRPGDKIEFSKWFYKRDSTHVQFFNQNSLRQLSNILGMQEARLIGDDLFEITQ